MSMGQAKATSLGNGKTNRIPQKPLNKFVKAQLLATLKRDDIKITFKAEPGVTTTTVSDSMGNPLFVYENAWDYGYYNIQVPDSKTKGDTIMIAEMDWYESDDNTNTQQQDIFDISKALETRRHELETIEEDRKNLTPEEIQALKVLGLSK
jgi:hypothetical protein